MQYLGGKSRIAVPISTIINSYSKDKNFVSLFCGSCAIESKIEAKNKTLNDSHPYLMAMWQELNYGWEIPDSISEEQYKYIKNNKDENRHLTGFVGFACSFGGKWFGGYARNSKGQNYAKTSKNSLCKKMKNLKSSNFICLDYKDVPIPDGSVVYCDPPYENTTNYSNSNNFNHVEFWEYMRFLGNKNKVFISEYCAPNGFIEVWKKSQKVGLDSRKRENIFVNVERLFTL